MVCRWEVIGVVDVWCAAVCLLDRGVWVIYVYVCVYICFFLLLGVCGIYVFTIHVSYVFLGLGYIQKVRVIIHDRGCSIHMGLCSIQVVIHKCVS